MTSSSARSPRTVALAVLRALAVLAVAVVGVGVAASPVGHGRAHLAASVVVRSAAATHELAVLASSARRVDRRVDRLVVAGTRAVRSVSFAGPALPTAPALSFTVAVRPHVVVAPPAHLGVPSARPHLTVVTARGPPVVA